MEVVAIGAQQRCTDNHSGPSVCSWCASKPVVEVENCSRNFGFFVLKLGISVQPCLFYKIENESSEVWTMQATESSSFASRRRSAKIGKANTFVYSVTC